MQVDSGLRALKQRSSQHFDAAQAGKSEFPGSSALLLFYAVECALKAALLNRRSGQSTKDLPDQLKTHDITKLVKELRLPPGSGPRPHYRLRQSSNETTNVPVERLHEAWRYGRDLHDEDMSDARLMLEHLYRLAAEDLKK